MDAFSSIQSHIASFYDIVHLWTKNWVLFLDINIQICVPPNIDLICGLVLIFLCGLLSVSMIPIIHDSFKQNSVHLLYLKQPLPLIQLLLRQ